MRSKILSLGALLSAAIVFTSVALSGETRYFLPFNIEYQSLSKSTQKQVDCLAQNIYHEAAYEPQEGKVASW